MPVFWGLDHSTRLVVITVKGVIRLKDMEDCVEGIMTPATLSYRKLVDMTEGSPGLSCEDIFALGELVREHAGGRATGALAVVDVSDESHRMRLFKSLSMADRSMRVFREIQSARDWLDTQEAYAPRLLPGEWPSDLADESPGPH
jgi:hypothetical protein